MKFTIEQYKDDNDLVQGTYHIGRPGDINDTYAVKVHVTDENDPDFHEYFWANVADTYDNWDEWFVYVIAMMEMYGWSYSE